MTSSGELQLRSGRLVRVQELRQRRFYEGLLEGLPTTEFNRRHLEDILAAERGRFYGADPVLIPPNETPISRPVDRPYRFGVPASFPEKVCVARLESPQPARDPSKHLSGLGVVWFQPEFAFPIEAGVLEQLRDLDWDRHAVDLEY
jgi:hypothetical protein